MQQKKKQQKERDDRKAGSPTDVLGSYTGVPSDPWEVPVQDADDL